MTSPDPGVDSPYDDPVGRTRHAWLRTSLGVAAVALLVVRGLVVDQAPAWLSVSAVAAGAATVAVCVARGRSLAGDAASGGAGSRAVAVAQAFRPYVATVGVVAVAAVGIVLAAR